jgi:hypothetical protein
VDCDPLHRNGTFDSQALASGPPVVRIFIFWIHLLKFGTDNDQIPVGSPSFLEALPRPADPTHFYPSGREVNMDNAPCPRCGDDKTVAGWSDLPDHSCSFEPDTMHWMRHLLWHFGESPHVRLPDRFRACLSCGLIWNSLPPERLREVLSREAVAVGDEWAPPLID